jgi:hypothetical protein
MVARVALGAFALGAVLFVVTLLPDVARYVRIQKM